MSSSPTMSLSDMMQQEDQPGPGQFGGDQAGSDAYAQAPPIGQGPSDDDVINAAGPEHGEAILNAHRDVQEAKANVQDAHLAYLGKTAEAIKASNYDPDVAAVLFQHVAGQPEFAAHVNQISALVQQNPQALKPIVDNVIESAANGGSGQQGTQGQGNAGTEQAPGGDDQDTAAGPNGGPNPNASASSSPMVEEQQQQAAPPQQGQQPARQAQQPARPPQAPGETAAETTATVTGRTVAIRRRAQVDDAYVTVETRTGTRAFRNNNPGNIVDGNFAQSNGAVGTDGRFAVFPNAAAGFQALNNLLMTPTYQNLSVDQAIARYAPPNENNTAAYQAGVRTAIGATGQTQLSALSADQLERMVHVIARIEGYHQGGAVTYRTEGHVPPRNYVTPER